MSTIRTITFSILDSPNHTKSISLYVKNGFVFCRAVGFAMASPAHNGFFFFLFVKICFISSVYKTGGRKKVVFRWSAARFSLFQGNTHMCFKSNGEKGVIKFLCTLLQSKSVGILFYFSRTSVSLLFIGAWRACLI